MDQELTYRLGESVLDLSRGTLRRAGRLVPLRPKTFKLLGYLAHNAGTVVSKDDLFKALWPRMKVTEDSLSQCVKDARRCIGDEEHTIIRTIPRRGYIYVAAGNRAPLSEPLSRVPRDLDFKLEPVEPRIAVLPFNLVGAGEAMKPAFDGMVEEITAALSNVATIEVLGRFSTLALARARSPNLHTALIGAEVDYLVEGQVQGGDPLFNLILTLSDVRSGRRLLTQTFFLKAEGVAAFHRAVARQVVSALVFNIETAAWQRTPQGITSVHMW